MLGLGGGFVGSVGLWVVLGAVLVGVGGGCWVVGLAFTPQLKQHIGFAVGGVVSYLADIAPLQRVSRRIECGGQRNLRISVGHIDDTTTHAAANSVNSNRDSHGARSIA